MDCILGTTVVFEFQRKRKCIWVSYSVFVIHLQEFLSNSLSSNTAVSGSDTKEKQQNDERSAGEPRGWLNWLSLGMLGAGGTADSSQFAGVVSDEIIKVF